MDPAHLVDTASQLRGIGFKAHKINLLRPWPRCEHQRPDELTTPWCSQSAERPKSRRNPALGADYVLDGIRPPAPNVLTDCLIDNRDPREIIGVSTRTESRTEYVGCRGCRK